MTAVLKRDGDVDKAVRDRDIEGHFYIQSGKIQSGKSTS